MSYPTETEARVALQSAEQAHQRVIDRIGMPWWYWWGLAGCWVVLGILSAFGAPWWVILAVTIAVGAVHSVVFQRLVAGRQRTADVQVRSEVAGGHLHLVVIGFLAALVGVTIAAALLLSADGAQHAAIWASGFVAVLIVLCGPRMMAWIRARATRRAARR